MGIKAFFWFLAGAESFILRECPKSQNQYFRTGLLIFLIGIISGISAGYAVFGSFDDNLFASVLVGTIWAIVIITLDSLIVSTIKDTGTFWDKLLVALPRIVFSIFIGIVIARPAEIKIFEKEIKDKIVDIQLKKCLERTDTETSTVSGQNTDLVDQRSRLQAGYDAVTKELTCVQNLLTDERNGIAGKRSCGSSSGRFGIGSRYRELGERIASLKGQQDNFLKRLSRINDQLEENNAHILAAGSVCNKEIIGQKINSEPLTLLQANAALNTLVFENTEDNKGVGSIILFITILIVLIELLPVLNKILFQEPSLEYQQKLQAFETDAQTMNYLDLLVKYPYLPARKQYLRNYQNNKTIHEKLLEEYVAISELNSAVQHKMDIILEKQQIQKNNEQTISQEIADHIKESQLKIVRELIGIWETQTLSDIKDNPHKYMDLPEQQPVDRDSGA